MISAVLNPNRIKTVLHTASHFYSVQQGNMRLCICVLSLGLQYIENRKDFTTYI